MKRKERDPREEKVLDYQRQRTNAYGENDKSSRKSIRFRKAEVNRTYRRGVNTAIARSAIDQIDEDAVRVTRRAWKKLPDIPLAVDIQDHMSTRERKGMAEARGPSPARREALSV
jgi:hypothetical protein